MNQYLKMGCTDSGIGPIGLILNDRIFSRV
jgi:hypothetical protein